MSGSRFRASRSDPSGLCRAEAYGNSFADSVSFRFPSRQSLGGSPASPAKYAPNPDMPCVAGVDVGKGERMGGKPPAPAPRTIGMCSVDGRNRGSPTHSLEGGSRKREKVRRIGCRIRSLSQRLEPGRRSGQVLDSGVDFRFGGLLRLPCYAARVDRSRLNSWA